jgi:chromosome segregation ATPase
LFAYALKSKNVAFDKIIGMIGGMIEVLDKEQVDDDEKRDYCNDEFAKSAQEKKDTQDKLAMLSASVEEITATIASLEEEMAALKAEIKSLDAAVAEATETRKEEHETYLKTTAENQAAQKILEKAKNKLNCFYKPTLCKEEVPAEVPVFFVQVRESDSDSDEAVPPPPPETFGAYQKKDGKSNGVLGLMDEMMDELKTDNTDAKNAEEMSQKDYEYLMNSSQKTREQSGKSLTEKEAAKAEWGAKIEAAKEETRTTQEGYMKLGEYIAGLHGSCDFLVQNYDMRKDARHKESEGLKNAKSVLSGATV